jgi:hypothetical protein
MNDEDVAVGRVVNSARSRTDCLLAVGVRQY